MVNVEDVLGYEETETGHNNEIGTGIHLEDLR